MMIYGIDLPVPLLTDDHTTDEDGCYNDVMVMMLRSTEPSRCIYCASATFIVIVTVSCIVLLSTNPGK